MSHHQMGFKISPLLQEHICRIGSKLTFEDAAEELSLMLRIEVNAKQVERICHCYGEKIDQIDWNEAYSDGVQLNIPGTLSDPVYCMADGSMLLTREEKWKEIKLGRIFSGHSHVDEISKERGAIMESVYSAHFGNSNDFWERFAKEIPHKRKLVFICDGAKWLWRNVDDLYPESTQILDYFHCKEHICEFAKAFYNRNPDKQKKFIDEIMDDLSNKKVKEALERIQQLKTKHKGKQKHKEKLLQYLRNNEKRIDYGKFIADGLLIGSGPIEAAHRDVIQKRLKLSGQRWTMKGAQQIANLRTYLKSNRWDRVLTLITDNLQAA